MWKFQDFSIPKILREINLENSWSAKSAISSHLEALNSDFYEFLYFLRAEIYQIKKMPKWQLKSSKLNSRKMWVIEKSWNFHTVWLFPNFLGLIRKYLTFNTFFSTLQEYWSTFIMVIWAEQVGVAPSISMPFNKLWLPNGL